MNLYYLIFLVLCVLCLSITVTGKKRADKICFIAAAIFLVFLAAARDISVGADTKNYCANFAKLSTWSFPGWLSFHNWEIGFILINQLLNFLQVNERGFLIVTSCLILIPIFVWMKKESPLPTLSLVAFFALGFWLGTVSALRQWCAMAIIVFSFRFIRERKLIPFVIMSLAAMLFHRTAAVILPLYFLYQLKVDGRLLLLGAVISLLLGVMGEPIMIVLNNFARHEVSRSFNGGLTMLVVLWVLVILTFWLERDHLSDPEVKLPFIMLLTAAVLQPIAFTFSLWSRIVRYYNFSMIIIIPLLYRASCLRVEGNQILLLAKKMSPKLYNILIPVWKTRGFQTVTLLMVLVVLGLWLYITNDGAQYLFMPL